MQSSMPAAPAPSRQADGCLAVFLAFLKLGLTSFGGPVAHLGYFRREFVARRGWLSDAAYSDVVALCQVLPGPSSSQVGFVLGLGRAGWPGALAAWLGFTAPSAVLLILFALGVQRWTALAGGGLVHGLKVLAVAVVAQAVWGMARTLCADVPRAALAVASGLLVLAAPSTAGQLAALVLGAAVGRWALPDVAGAAAPVPFARVSPRWGAWCLALLVVLVAGSAAMAALTPSALWGAVAACVRAGALVFGGGHVVLPWLQAGLVQPGFMSPEAFLAGYGAAQAVPGPLFTFAAYLGAALALGGSPWVGGVVLLVAIFLPALLVVAGALPFWDRLRGRPAVRRALAGVNASVVGVLGAALWSPVGTSAIRSPADALLALAALALLLHGRVPLVAVVLLCAGAGLAFS